MFVLQGEMEALSVLSDTWRTFPKVFLAIG